MEEKDHMNDARESVVNEVKTCDDENPKQVASRLDQKDTENKVKPSSK